VICFIYPIRSSCVRVGKWTGLLYGTELYRGYKLGNESKLGGTRGNSGEGNTGGKDFIERKDHLERLIREDFIGKTNREDYSAHLLICKVKPY